MEWLRRLAIGFSLAALTAACLSAFSAAQDASPRVETASSAGMEVVRCATDVRGSTMTRSR